MLTPLFSDLLFSSIENLFVLDVTSHITVLGESIVHVMCDYSSDARPNNSLQSIIYLNQLTSLHVYPIGVATVPILVVISRLSGSVSANS